MHGVGFKTGRSIPWSGRMDVGSVIQNDKALAEDV